jgi:adenylosuccinate lyase
VIQRYSRPEMRAIWTDENKLKIWLQIELLASEALVADGVVPKKDFAKMKAGADKCFADTKALTERAKELEKTLNHDVIGFTTAVAEQINDQASRWLHFGLTSSDIVDTAFAVQMVQSADILIKDVEALLPVIARRAKEHMLTPCIGRSHGIHGEPTTFGLKLALMHEEFVRALSRFKHVRDVVAIGKLSGAVGTNAHLSPKIEAYVCKKLGLEPASIATQVVQRDIHAEFMNCLALVAASFEHWAVEFRHLQRTEVLEAEEPFDPGQKGSSAMPHKRNPILTENLTGLARLVRSAVTPAMENVALWHERDISHSSVERGIGPDATIHLDFALHRLAMVVERLVVYPDNMARNLDRLGGLVHSQRVLLALTQAGVSREDGYAAVQRNAMKVWRGEGNFLDFLKADPDVVVPDAELEALFDLGYHTKHVDTVFQRVFG